VKPGRSRCEDGASLRAEAIASAERLFLQWGYDGASTAMIAEELGVTKAALYYHFPDKESLFLAVFDDYLDGVSAELVALSPLFADPAGNPQAAFKALALVFLAGGPDSAAMQRLCFQESPRLSEEGRKVLAERYHLGLVDPLASFLEKAREAGWIRSPEPGEPQRVWTFMGLLSAFFAPGHPERVPPEPGSVDRSAEVLARLLLSGLGAREAK
jgi:AcrR family transcriptional regulator